MNEKDVSGLVSRYEQMLAEGKSIYFDAEEFDSLAEYYDLQDDVEQAESILDQALLIHPNNQQLRLKKIKFMTYDGSYAEALEALISNFSGYDLDLYLLKIDCYLHLGRYDEANALATETIENEDSDLDILYSELGFLYIECDHFEDSISFFESSLLYDPQNEEVLIELAYAYEIEGDFDSSIRICNLLLDINPYAFEVWVNLGKLYSIQEEYEKAVDALEFASTTGKLDPNIVKLKAHCLLLSERTEEAIEVFREYLQDSPTDDTVLYSLAECYFSLEEYDQMLHYLDLYEGVKGEDIDTIAKKAFAYLQKEDYVMVLNLIEKGLVIEPENEDLNIVAGEYYFQQGNYILSETFFLNAYNSGDKKNKILLDRLTAIFIAKGEIEEAIVYMENLLKLENNEKHKIRLSLLYFELGDKKRFNAHLESFSDSELRSLALLFYTQEQFDIEKATRVILINRLNDALDCRQLFKNSMY